MVEWTLKRKVKRRERKKVHNEHFLRWNMAKKAKTTFLEKKKFLQKLDHTKSGLC